MDENKLDKLIEQNITEARTLWLGTLPSKGELSRHSFTPRFRMKIRRMAGMKYTLFYFLKLVGVGLVSVFLGYLPMFLTVMPMAPLLFLSFTERMATMLGAIGSVFAAPVTAYFLRHFWWWLGEWSHSRELGSHRVTMAVSMAVPGLMAVACSLQGYIPLPEWVMENAIYQMLEGGIGPFRVLAGQTIFKDLFRGSGALLWLAVYGGIFYAGNRGRKLTALWKPLYAMGFMAGFYEAALVLQQPQMLVWFKAGYLLTALWLVWNICGRTQRDRRMKVVVMALAAAVAVLLMVLDLTDADEVKPRAMPLFAHTMEEIFPGYGRANIEMMRNGGDFPLDAAMQAEIWKQLGTIDLRDLRETDSETIADWQSGPLRIRLEIQDSENPCVVTLAEVRPRIDGAGDRIYRLGLTFPNGEEYIYTGDDPEQLPLDFFRALVTGEWKAE